MFVFIAFLLPLRYFSKKLLTGINLYDRATLPLQNGCRGLDCPDFFYGIRWASRLATLDCRSNLFIVALYWCCCYAKWWYRLRGGETVEMEGGGGEEITKEQYGVEPDVPSTNLSILFAITALSFSLSLSNISHLPYIIPFFFLISTYFFLRFVQLRNQKSKHYITR